MDIPQREEIPQKRCASVSRAEAIFFCKANALISYVLLHAGRYNIYLLFIPLICYKKRWFASDYCQEVFNMLKYQYPDHVQSTVAGGHGTGKRTEELEELQFAKDLYDNGAYTNGILGI